MNGKSTISTGPDRDDPPRFTREMAERGRHMIGDKVIRQARPRGRPAKAAGEHKEKVTLRLSPDVINDARGSGAGWQTRIDEQMRHIQGFQRMILTGKEPPPRTEMERQLREVMKTASELINGRPHGGKADAVASVLRGIAADHEKVAKLMAEILGTAPLVSAGARKKSA